MSCYYLNNLFTIFKVAPLSDIHDSPDNTTIHPQRVNDLHVPDSPVRSPDSGHRNPVAGPSTRLIEKSPDVPQSPGERSPDRALTGPKTPTRSHPYRNPQHSSPEARQKRQRIIELTHEYERLETRARNEGFEFRGAMISPPRICVHEVFYAINVGTHVGVFAER